MGLYRAHKLKKAAGNPHSLLMSNIFNIYKPFSYDFQKNSPDKLRIHRLKKHASLITSPAFLPSRQIIQCRLKTPHAFFNYRHRGGKGETDETISPKGHAGDRGNQRLIQQIVGQFQRTRNLLTLK